MGKYSFSCLALHSSKYVYSKTIHNFEGLLLTWNKRSPEMLKIPLWWLFSCLRTYIDSRRPTRWGLYSAWLSRPLGNVSVFLSTYLPLVPLYILNIRTWSPDLFCLVFSRSQLWIFLHRIFPTIIRIYSHINLEALIIMDIQKWGIFSSKLSQLIILRPNSCLNPTWSSNL